MPDPLAALPPDVEAADLVNGLEAAACLRSFAFFCRRAWTTIHGPSEPLRWNWCMAAVCAHLQAQAEGRINDLLISIPPGFGKSLLVSVFYVAWRWALDPRYQHLAVSGLPDLAIRDALRTKDVVESPWYQDTFRPDWTWDGRQDAKTFFKTTKQGVRWSRTVGQKIIGMRPGTPGGITLDDPLDASEAYSDKAGLQKVNNWYRYSLSTRRAVGNRTPVTVIMQRLHENDLIGSLLSTLESAAQWCYLCIPQEWDGREKVPTAIGWEDPRTTPGEFIDLRLFGPEQARAARIDLTSMGYATQHQQLPAPPEGAIYRKTMIRHWTTLPCFHPFAARGIAPPTTDKQWDYLVISVDATYVNTKDSDRAAAGVWGVRGNRVYFLDMICKKMTPSQLILEVRGLLRRWEGAGAHVTAVIVESKSMGPNVMKYLQSELVRVVPYNPQGVSKIERVMATLAPWEANEAEGPPTLEIPPIDSFPWVRDLYLPELLAFPGARHDDTVDQGSQALIYFRNKNLLRPYARVLPK